MKKNTQVKISLTIFFIIIALSIIVIMGIYIYKITVEKDNILKDKYAERMAKETLEKYIELSDFENSAIGPMPNILVELGLENQENINLLTDGIYDASTYIKSNTKYEEFKDKLLEYMTENYFMENFSQYKNIDGYVGFCNCAGGTILTEIEKITLKSIDGTTYNFNVVFKDIEMYEHYLNPAGGENITEDDYLFDIQISFKYINNKLVIDQWKAN